MNTPLLAALLLTLALAACAAAPRAPQPTGLLLRELPAPTPLRFAVYVPRDYDQGRDWPLVLFLHGRGESGDDGLKQCVQGLGSAIQWNVRDWPCIALFPQKPDQDAEWETYDDALMRLLDLAQREWRVDPDRVTLTGLSQGGHGCWVLASRHPGRFAAVAPICGYVSRAATPRPYAQVDLPAADALAARLSSLPIWAFHGERDDVVPPSHTRALVDACRRTRTPASPEIRATFFPDANHNSWDAAYRDSGLSAWMLAQRRAANP